MLCNKFLTALFLLFTTTLAAQQTGSFSTTIMHDGQTRIIEYMVPTDYSAANKYPLVMGLHGCVGGSNPAQNFRDDLAFLADSIQAIVVCPNGPLGGGNLGATMDGPEHTIILAALDSTKLQYNIDTTALYLVGFSCNGYVTAKYGTNELKPWKGVIPFNPYFANASVLTDGTIDYTNTTSTCVCVGSLDPNLPDAQTLRDGLQAGGSDYLYNLIQGVGHTTNFAGFNTEIMECMNFFSTTSTAGIDEAAVKSSIFLTYPNPFASDFQIKVNSGKYANKPLQLDLYNLQGQVVYSSTFTNSTNINADFDSGLYFIEITSDDGFQERKSVVKL